MSPIGRRCVRLEPTHAERRAALLGRAVFVLLSLAAAAGSGAELNLGFESLDANGRPVGWSSAAGDAEVASDGTAAEGERSLKLTRASAGGVTRLTRRV